MIQLDPEDILGAGCADALGRILLGFGTLAAGGFAGALGCFCFSVIDTAVTFLLISGTWTPIVLPDLAMLFLLPIWGFASYTAMLAIPNTLIALVYFSKNEDPTLKRFLVHAGIHQLATFVTLADHFGSFDALSWTGMGVLDVVLFLTNILLQVATFSGLIFIALLIKNRLRIRHQEHLMTVASINQIRKAELAQKVHVPPPPAGTKPPQARPLKAQEEKNELGDV